ncbi:AAA family ATPase, partial [Candidatus Falkowbacteria bacterium]|nr:AAA family ATPase [Candidatus Falkowbacteria bacterium]
YKDVFNRPLNCWRNIKQKLMRISIIGITASGKTTLAKRISQKLNIPHLAIDKLWFEAGGHKLKKFDHKEKEKVRERVKAEVKKLIKQEAWVSDGLYSIVQPEIARRADMIIFIDIPMARRLFNHLHRIFFTERPAELNKWDEIKFIYQVIRRTFVYKPKIRKIISENKDKVKIFKNYKDLNKFVEKL